jgi:hypothetical protein
MWKSQVFKDALASKRPIPQTTPSHVSWTTSSAKARDATMASATVIIRA